MMRLVSRGRRMEPLSLPMHLSAGDSSFSWRFKQDWLKTVCHFAAEEEHDCYGAKLLEIGAGIHNPLGCALIALAKGAELAVAIEPGQILPEHLDHAILSGFIAEHKAKARNPGLRKTLDMLLSRIGDEHPGPESEIKTPAIELFRGTIQDYVSDCRFDIVHSNAVIEHILDLDGACSRFYDLTAPGGIHLHKVDFIDHRYYEVVEPSADDAFRFLLTGQEGNTPDCNGLRLSEVIATFARSGLEFVRVAQEWQLPLPEKFLPKLQDRYRDMSQRDLQTTCATLLFRKPLSM